MRAAPQRSLWPREHRAYGQLAVPPLAALASSRPGPTSAAPVVAIGAGFLTHEPALVVAGHRGPRVRSDHGARARGRVGTLAVVASVASGFLIVRFSITRIA